MNCVFRNVLLFLLVFPVGAACAQSQLVFLKNETVIARWEAGDLIDVKLKSGEKTTFAIAILGPFYFVTPTLDTVRFLDIDKVKVARRVSLFRGIGGALFWGGIGLFLVDQFNTTFIVRGGPQISESVLTTSLVGVGVGSVLLLAKRNYFPLRGRKLLSVDSSSPFYRPMD